jgi:hypothetical protein
MNRKKIFAICVLCVSTTFANAQGLALNTDGISAHNSAMLDVSSSAKGILIPRMSAAQKNAITSPAMGLLIYQIDSAAGFYYYNSVGWQAIGGNWASTAAGVYSGASRIGIGTSTPAARLHVADSNVLFTGAATPLFSGASNPPASGTGSRMMWYADKAAFRAGTISGSGSAAAAWEKDSMGVNSFASGRNTKAIGFASTSAGYGTTSRGDYSFTTGHTSVAQGNNSVALGYLTTASGFAAVVMGSYSSAGGYTSLATGLESHADGNYALAMGNHVYASGNHSVALGYNVSTNGNIGSFIIGDASASSSPPTATDNSHQMMMRFQGGYKFYTNSSASIGVQVTPGGNSWSTISDVRKKENFAPVNGEEFLNKIAAFKLTSWNYKGQDAKLFRHYGPMAQDFYAAFGKDSYGSIGNDTTINQADMEGISFVAIQALEKRTREQQEEIAKLKAENAILKAESQKVAELNSRMEAMEASLKNYLGVSKK